jgi:C4-dicarboxylate-specific signal transduction histidine kinase
MKTTNIAALSNMASGVAHEINNPLTIINGCTNKMLKLHSMGKLDEQSLNSNMNKIFQTTQRIAGIIRSLRIFSRDGSSDERKVFNIDEIIQDTLNFVGEQFKQDGINLEISSNINNILVWGQRTELSQALLHIVRNAYDAVAAQDQKNITISIIELAGSFILKVTDNGEGISKEALNKVFEPFFTTKQIKKSTGLGLTMAKTIVESHGGRIFIEQTSNSTSVCVKMPKYQKNKEHYFNAA